MQFEMDPVASGQVLGHLIVNLGSVELVRFPLQATIGVGTIVGALIGIGWRPRFPMRAAMLAITAWPVAAGPRWAPA